MSTARAIQVSVTHVSVGIFAGACIEALMPAYSASASNAALMFEAFVQIALNGVLLSQVGSQLTSDDPTFGLPFSLGLFEAQPSLQKRIAALAAVAKLEVSRAALKMAPPSAEAASTN
tara:strand:- start:4798 stop:5151 length:354 start_codon:yes stop_codon:yes gene_type:complete